MINRADFRSRKNKVTWIGLDNAGKTTLLKRIMTDTFFGYTIRTIGLETQEFIFGDIKYICWDISGQQVYRKMYWPDYILGSLGLIWVIDSAEPNRFKEAKEELWKYVISNPQVKSVPLLIFASKQDLKNSVSVKKISKTLELKKIKNLDTKIFATSAKTGKNIDKGLDWLRNKIVGKNWLPKAI